MTVQEINVAIAEACGWESKEERGEVCGIHGCVFSHFVWYQNGCRVTGVYHFDESPVPNYCHDLNAMHEAEKTLTHEQILVFRRELAKPLAGPEGYEWNEGYERAIHATARQRAEAFLRTIGKWQPQPRTEEGE